jgi:beta-glucanase (GH16 family)
MKHLALLALGAALASGACARNGGQAVRNERAPCPLQHGVWEPLPELWDEFGGAELDATKWHPNNPGWKGRQPGLFHTGNVAVSDGKLHITMKHEDLPGLPDGYHTYTCGAVKSKARVRYGYFEVRCRPMDSKGSSAFWFYDGTPEIWTEIDVFEMGAGHPKHERTVHMNAHVFHTLVNPDRHWSQGGRWQAPWRLADGCHVYGLEWSPDDLAYSVDGQVVRRMKNTHWHQPLHLNFDSETMPQWFGLPEVESLPSTFSIDYVRAWRRVDARPEAPMKSCTFEFPAAEAPGKTVRYTLKTDDAGSLTVVARLDHASKPALVYLEYDNPAFFQAQRAATASRRIAVKDKAGREVVFAIAWSKVEGEKRNNGYRPDTVDVQPAARPKIVSEQAYEFVSDHGALVRMKLEY